LKVPPLTIQLSNVQMIAVAASAIYGCANVPTDELKLIAVAGARKAAVGVTLVAPNESQ
jgi:hypothetical protein